MRRYVINPSPPSFKMLWFEVCGLSFAASAHHFLSIRVREELPSGAPVVEVCDVLGLTHARSQHIGGIAHPRAGLIWLGLGERATLYTCEAHNILVFPPWLHTDCAPELLPACLAHARPHHDALTWILDVAQIAHDLAHDHYTST